MSSIIIEYNNNLEDNDTLLNNEGYYTLYGYNNTIVYSTKYDNNNNNNNYSIESIIFPTTSKEFSLFGIHKTLNIQDSNQLLNHSTITSDIKNESIKLLKSLLCSIETTRSYYTISFTIIRETSQIIEKSQILFFQVSSKDLETIIEINTTKKIEVPLIIEDLNKSFYLFNYYTNHLSSVLNLNNLINNNNNNNQNNHHHNNNNNSIYYYINNSSSGSNNNNNNNSNSSSPTIFSLNSTNLDKRLVDILSNSNNNNNNNNSSNNKTSMNIISIELLLKITNNNNNSSSSSSINQSLISPMISLNLNNNNSCNNSSKSNIYLSNLCLISKSDTIKETIELFNKSISYQINNKIINQSSCNYKSLHFQFSFLPFPITTLYKVHSSSSNNNNNNNNNNNSSSNSNSNSSNIDDNENYDIRKQYHEIIGLPLNRPYLKSSLSINLLQSSSSSLTNNKKIKQQQQHQHLKDIHLNLSLDSKTGGNVFIVDGSFDYYHYLQDNIDDNGWGCAYRSMQTICSWLKYQNFTNKSIPNHYEIQKILVELKDKDPSFLKSKQWIGAFEITLCLDYLYGIKCKILNITSGSEIVYKSREIAKHFQLNGSPIMIGGGVLAYTLLGIDFNESTGETRYLILDPHYTGSTDNIKLIKEKGWCAWKTSDQVFRKDAFYNLCQPQIPNDL